MGHVNNAVIMEYLDLGKDAFFSGHGLSPTKSDFTVMVVHYDVDFRQQIHYHDRIHVENEIEKLGNKSLTMMQRVVNSETGVVCVECRTVMAGYRRSTSSSEVIPDEVRQWLTR
jgi:acyl-CoA thioester hydrolase